MKLDPSHTAAVAVHLQRDIVDADGAFADFFYTQVRDREVIPRVRALTDRVRDDGGTVVFTRVAWQPDYSDLNANSALLQLVRQTGSLGEGTPGAELVDDTGRQDADLVHTHQRISGLTSELEDELRARGVDTVLICGVATNASVEGTARQFSDAGFVTYVVDEACSAATPAAHQASIESLGLVAGVCSLDDALRALSDTEVVK